MSQQQAFGAEQALQKAKVFQVIPKAAYNDNSPTHLPNHHIGSMFAVSNLFL